MASSKEYLDFILEQLSDLEDVSSRAMMGEYYRNERFELTTCGWWAFFICGTMKSGLSS